MPQRQRVDLTNCDREPIHIPGRIQPHGVLVALEEPELTVQQVSVNVDRFFAAGSAELLGQPLAHLVGEGQAELLRELLRRDDLERNPLYVCTLKAPSGDGYFNLVAHRSRGMLVLELERSAQAGNLSFQNLYAAMRTSVARLEQADSVDELCQFAAEEVRRITGFDRVMVYQFDHDWNGTVIAEDRRPDLDPFLGHHYPASDIPAQARQLYLLNRLRLIPDARYTPAEIVPELTPGTDRPLDLSFSVLRSVSPIHLEYLRNMGVIASMSISIVRDGRLWGLIACHHLSPRYLPFEVRTACELMGQLVSLQLDAKERHETYEHRVRLSSVQSRLVEKMAGDEDFVAALRKNESDLLHFMDASGALLCFESGCIRLGRTPDSDASRALLQWLGETMQEDLFATDSLATTYPAAAAFREVASGIVALRVSGSRGHYLVWFRPEVIRTINWAGNPDKAATVDHDGMRIHPRKSFELWKQTVQGRSLPWKPAELSAAMEFRNALVGIVLRKAEELSQLNAELERSNRELEAFSYSVSHDLRAPFRHIVGFSDLLIKRSSDHLDETGIRYLKTIAEAARQAGMLVDSLLAFSQMGRQQLRRVDVDMEALVREAKQDVQSEAEDRVVRWNIRRLPHLAGDPTMLRLVWRNLLSNAVKYTRTRAVAEIEVGCDENDLAYVFYVRDNGVGFDMRYVEKLFGVFQRLHRMEEYEGTGIGLANVRRIVERHGGRAWAEAELGSGATFYFALPKPENES